MIKHTEPTNSNIPALYKPTIGFELNKNIRHLIDSTKNVQLVEYFLTSSDVSLLVDLFNTSNVYEDVSVHGLKGVDCKRGSTRTTIWSEELAYELSLKLFTNSEYCTDEYSRTDSWQHTRKPKNKWSFYGFSPMLRFMKYENDAAYIYPDTNYRTLKSVVIYLTTNKSGATRLISDNQDSIKQKDRNNSDWSVETNEDQIFKKVLPIRGNMLVFDHRICHDVEKFIPQAENDVRMIIRGDLIYKLND